MDMLPKLIVLLFWNFFLASPGVHGCGGGSSESNSRSASSIRSKIAEVANSKVGLTHWSFASSSGHGANTSKCDYFVYDVGIEAGAKMPKRGLFRGPVGAGSGGWGDKGASLSSWSQVHSLQPGDIVAGKTPGGAYHVGIFVGNRMIVSANPKDVGKNNKMLSYTDLVYWRYQG